jgi:single-stranded-DNA-specific exonuclease
VANAGLPLINRILASRGLTDPVALKQFLEPSLRQMHDPSLIPDLDRAAERLLTALAAHEPIVIYGDYDVDGITAATILFQTFRTISPDAPVRIYIPHRLDEGYGLNSAAMTQLAAEGARVIVSVDCGITAREPAAAARQAGVDLIITDHHNPPESLDQLPDAYAIVPPATAGLEIPIRRAVRRRRRVQARVATCHASLPFAARDRQPA